MDYKTLIMAQAFGGDGGGGDTVEPLEVTANGTYEESGKAYSPVTVNVSGGASLETIQLDFDAINGDGVTNVKVQYMNENGQYVTDMPTVSRKTYTVAKHTVIIISFTDESYSVYVTSPSDGVGGILFRDTDNPPHKVYYLDAINNLVFSLGTD